MKANLVLINPRIYGPDSYPPISLLCLAAYVRQQGHTVAIIDAAAEQLTDEEVVERIKAYNPILCGITFMTNQYGIVGSLVSVLKSHIPNMKLVAGGVHVSVIPNDAKTLRFDYCVVGEGELCLENLLTSLENGEVVTDFIFQSPMIQDLDSLPLPAWDLVPIPLYGVSQPELPYNTSQGVTLSIETSRGCLFNCAFCASHAVYGKTHRERSPKSIVNEIEWLTRTYGVTRFFLVDESILGNVPRAEAFADEILKRGLEIEFVSSARVTDRGVNRETLLKMRSAGMRRVGFGVESGSPRILREIKKGITVPQIIGAHKIAHETGLTTTSLMIVGHLEETWDDIVSTLELVANLDTDFPEFGPLTPYPGTEVYASAKKEGWLQSDDWSEYYISNTFRVMRNRHFSFEEIAMLHILCAEAVCLMTALKHGNSIKDVLMPNWTFPAIGAEGRALIVAFMETRDRKHLESLRLSHLTYPITARIKLGANPENIRLVKLLKQHPWRIVTKPKRLHTIRLALGYLHLRHERQLLEKVVR